ADPYAADKPLFTITAQNAAQYADKLSPGQMAMLKKHPTYKLNVYTTRRSAALPQTVYDDIKKNAAQSQLTSGGNGVGNSGTTARYTWKLAGKKEMYIASNVYKLSDKSLKTADVLKPGNVNPDLVRYELRRVWVVEGDLKEGKRHVFAKRVMYFDEDTFQLAA